MTKVWPYHFPQYDSKERFISYWHQINEILLLNPKKVLEIGVGSGFVSRYLKEKGIKVTTLDIDKRLKPDVVGSVSGIPFKDESFDVVSCYEVLEHSPYEDFGQALSELFRVAQSYVILSLPDVTKSFHISLITKKPINQTEEQPKPKNVAVGFSIPHLWEIGQSGYPLKKINNEIQKIGFEIQKTYRAPGHQYHRFFVLKK